MHDLALAIVCFVATYLIHSTCFLLVIAGIVQVTKQQRREWQVTLWRTALLAPIATSLLVTQWSMPHFGILIPFAAQSSAEIATQSSAEIASRTAAEAADPTNRPSTKHSEIESFPSSPTLVPLPAESEWRHADRADHATTSTSHVPAKQHSLALWLAALLLVGIAIAMTRFTVQIIRLRTFRRQCRIVRSTQAAEDLATLAVLAGVTTPRLLMHPRVAGPLTAGMVRPFICLPERWLDRISRDDLRAMFAHELIHIRRRDTAWKWITQIVCSLFYVQPLNRFARRQIDLQTEFIADRQAARLVDQKESLAGCLARLADWLAAKPTAPVAMHSTDGEHLSVRPMPMSLVSGMALFRSTLGRRIEALLSPEENHRKPLFRGSAALTMVTLSLAAITIAPRAIATTDILNDHHNIKETNVNQRIAWLALLASVTTAAPSDEPRTQPTQTTKSTVDPFPDGLTGFNGMLVGRLMSKDVEKGTFVINVDAVPRVWRNSKAKRPRALVGKNIRVDGVSGKWADALLLIKRGESLETEARHDDGDKLTFPGELLRKVAPFSPDRYPSLPEGFRGFRGAVAAKIVRKDAELMEMVIAVDKVLDTFQGNQAEQPESIEGKKMLLAGFWRRKEDFHRFNVGQAIEVGMQHIGRQSDHLSVQEFIRRAGERSGKKPQAAKSSVNEEMMTGGAGFKGIIVGRLVKKDVERGTFEVMVDRVPRVWKNNRARDPKSLQGTQVSATGLTGKHLDALLVTQKGETIEFGAFGDEAGQAYRVVELFRKVAPIKPGDYPELPEGLRGFRGELVGKVVKKDPTMLQLNVKVLKVKRTWDQNRASQARSAVGNTISVGGFWRRKETYHQLAVGDTIEFGALHQVRQSDNIDVAEQVKKVEAD